PWHHPTPRGGGGPCRSMPRPGRPPSETFSISHGQCHAAAADPNAASLRAAASRRQDSAGPRGKPPDPHASRSQQSAREGGQKMKVRWGILGTANIARAQFLPGLREAGGVAAAVAGRDAGQAERYARDNGIERAIGGYQNLIDDPEVDALYIPLPNSLHAEWTLLALAAGRPVLCEKPLCGNLGDTLRVLDAARHSSVLLWEAFVFPFHRQIARIRDLVAGGAIGELMEIKAHFHFQLSNPGNIRYSRELEGGALNDVGCYPIRLAAEFFGVPHEAAWAGATWGGDGVDVDTWGVLEYPGGRRLHLSCGLGRSYDT